MSPPAAPDAQASPPTDPDRILLEAVKQRHTGICLRLLQQRVHRHGLTGLDRLVNQLRNEAADPGAAAWFLCLLELEAIPYGGSIGTPAAPMTPLPQVPHQGDRAAEPAAPGRPAPSPEVLPARTNAAAPGKPESAAAAGPVAGRRPASASPGPEPTAPGALPAAMLAAQASPAAAAISGRQGSAAALPRPEGPGGNTAALAGGASPAPSGAATAAASPLIASPLEERAGAAVDAAFAALAATFPEGISGEPAAAASSTPPAEPRTAGPAASAAPAPTTAAAAVHPTAAAAASLPAGPRPATTESVSSTPPAEPRTAGPARSAAPAPAPANAAAGMAASGSAAPPQRRQPPMVIPQLGWSGRPAPNLHTASTDPATTPAQASTATSGQKHEPAVAASDGGPAGVHPDAELPPSGAATEPHPPSASGAPAQEAAASTAAPGAAAADPPPREAATANPRQRAVSQLLLQGKAAVRGALTTSRSNLADLCHRGGRFGRARLRGMRDLLRVCLEESLSPLRSASGPAAREPWLPLSDAPLPRDRSDAAAPEAFPADLPPPPASPPTPSPGRPATSRSASSEPISGKGTPAAWFGPNREAAPPEPASTRSLQRREAAYGRGESEDRNPAPTPAALSDLQAWLPNCPDLPRAS